MTESSDPKPELEIKSDADWKQRVKTEAAELDAQRAQEAPQAQDGAQEALQAQDGAQEALPTQDATATSAAAEGVDAESSGASSQADIDAAQFPPADFTMLISMFSTQAMVALGLIPNPVDGQAESNLGLARHFIDLLGILDEKTRGNLTGDESDLLEQSLHELRMAYVERSRSGH